MATIDISGNSYFSYATVAEADAYLIPDPSYATWSPLTDDQKGGFLVTSSRFLDSLLYIDSADTQEERELIPVFADATILIASLLASGDLRMLGMSVAEPETKRYKAGSVELEYFRSFSSYFTYNPYSAWPQRIFLLIKPYLKAQNIEGIGGAKSFGTCGVSQTYQNYDMLNVP